MRNDTRVPIGTSLNVISYRSGGTGWSDIAAKLRQLGWMCVEPTPLMHCCADGGRSVRLAVDPMNTIRTMDVVEPGPVGGDGVLASSQSLSEILCVGHNMRSVHAPKTENVHA
jgi:hypothetical protein